MAKDEADRLWLSSLSRTLETEFGRQVIWRLLDEMGITKSVLRHHEGLTPDERAVFNGSRQDLGHWLMGEISVANPKTAQLMVLEAYERKLEVNRLRNTEE